MKKLFFLKRFVFICFLCTISLAACNNNGKPEKEDDDKTEKETPKDGEVKPLGDITFNDNLYILYATADEFKKLPNKGVVFSYTFNGTDNLTLAGWPKKVSPKDPFDTIPTVTLQKTVVTLANYTNKTFFGNLILHQKGVNYFQDELKKPGNKNKIVLFIPTLYNNRFIKYQIFLSDTIPTAKFVIPNPLNNDELDMLNPSPPKQYEY